MKNLLCKFLGVTLLSSALLVPSVYASSPHDKSSAAISSLGCHYEPGGPEGEVCLFLKEDTQQPEKLLFSVVRFTPLDDNTSNMDFYTDYTLYNRNLRSGGTESILQFTQSGDGYQMVDLSTLPCGINQIEAKLSSGETTGMTIYEKSARL